MPKVTLEQKLADVKDTHSEINKIKKIIVKDTKDLHELLRKRRELEHDIEGYLLNGGRIEDPLLDYCFREFCFSFGGNRNYDSCVFDMVPKVERFLKNVEENKGEKVLVVQGDSQETGIISGNCQFSIEKTFRYLHIPVEKLLVLNSETGNWGQGKTNLAYINPDIFQHPSNISREGIWITDHSNEIYVGGHPKKTFIYIGNSFVEKGLEKHPIPARKQEIGSIPY